jgi:hypothetical protein
MKKKMHEEKISSVIIITIQAETKKDDETAQRINSSSHTSSQPLVVNDGSVACHVF